MRRWLRSGLLVCASASALAGGEGESRPVREIRTWTPEPSRPTFAVVVGLASEDARGRLSPLRADTVEPGDEIAPDAVLLVGVESAIRDGMEPSVRVFAGRGVVYVDAWKGDAEWLASLAPGGAVRPLTAADAPLARPTALDGLPPAHADPDPTIVGVVADGEIRVVASRQNTLCHPCSCPRRRDQAAFAANLARHAAEVASRVRARPQPPSVVWGAASLRGRRLQVEAILENRRSGPATTTLRLLSRDGARVAETVREIAAGAEETILLDVVLPTPFDVVAHRVVATVEDDALVERRVAPLVDLVGAPEVVLAHTGRLVAGAPAAARIVVRNSKTGEPVHAATVDLALVGAGAAALAATQARTDAAGTLDAALRVPSDADSELTLTAAADTAFGRESVSAPARALRTHTAHVFLDLPVHRPGDTVRFRLLVVDPASGRAAEGVSVEVRLEGPDGRTSATTSVRTAAHGVASGELPIAESAPTGDYRVVAERLGGADLRVERFEVPRFRVSLDPVPRGLHARRGVEGSVVAERFDGSPIEGAAVTVSLRSPELGAPPVARWEGSTDGRGRAAYRIDPPFDADTAGGRDLGLDVAVRDAGGRTVREFVRLAPRPTGGGAPSVHLPHGALVAGLPGTAVLRTDLAAGSTVEVRAADAAPHRATVDDLGFVEVPITKAEERFEVAVGDRAVVVRAMPGAVALSAGRRLIAEGASVPVRATVLGEGESLFVDVVWQGALVATRRLRVVGGVAAGWIELPAGVTGHVLLQASTTAARAASDAVVGVFVLPRESLRVSMAPSSSEVRPGGAVDIDVQVSDAAGRGAPAALALRVVDEAVLSIVGRPTEVARFALAADSARFLRRDGGEPSLGDLAAASLVRPLTAGERRLADILVSRADRRTPLDARATSLAGRREAHRRAVAAQFEAWSVEFAGRAAEVLAGEAAPAPSDAVPDVVAAIRAAARRGAFGADGLLDPWGNPLEFGAFTPLPGTGPGDASVTAAGPFRRLCLRSPGPDGVFFRRDDAFDDDDVEFVGDVVGGDDVTLSLTAETTVALHSAWLRRHGKGIDAAALVSSATWIDGTRRGGRRYLRAGGGGRAGELPPAAERPRARRAFPSAITWDPLLVTDAAGRARIRVTAPDSVTTWRAETVAHAAAGGVGQGETRFRTTLPFVVDADVPPRLFSGDEVEIPAILRFTTAVRSDVVAEVEVAGPLRLLSPPKIALPAVESGETVFGIRVVATGQGTARLTVRAAARSGPAATSDAVEREIPVLLAGRRESASRGFRSPSGSAAVAVPRPAAAVAGTERLELRLPGGPLDQILDGVAGLVRTPKGCFEQASSAMFPNVLALELLGGSERLTPELRRRLDAAIDTGTELLLSYEIPGGGFDWFGKPPAALLLSAYGAQEWWMLHRVRRREGREDPDGGDGAGAVALRTSRWIAARQRPDGSFPSEGVPYAWRGTTSNDVATTSYAAWSILPGRRYDPSIETAIGHAGAFVASRVATCDDPYALALATVFLAEAGEADAAADAARRMAQWIREGDGAARVDGGRGSAFHGRGEAASVEATALAALAASRLAANHELPLESLLAELSAQRRHDGTWGTTQATVLALRVFAERATDALPENTAVRISSGASVRRIVLGDGGGGVVADLGAPPSDPADGTVSVTREGGGPISGTWVCSWDAAWDAVSEGAGDVRIARSIPATVRIGAVFGIGVELVNRRTTPVAMPIVEVPLPAGVLADGAELRRRPPHPRIERIETDAERVVLYLRELGAGERLTVSLPVTARLRGRVVVPPAEARPYYEPRGVHRSSATKLVVE